MSVESLAQWIARRREEGDDAVRVAIVADGVADDPWDVIGGIMDALGGGESNVGVSSTCGFMDVSGKLRDGRTIHIYLGDGS